MSSSRKKKFLTRFLCYLIFLFIVALFIFKDQIHGVMSGQVQDNYWPADIPETHPYYDPD